MTMMLMMMLCFERSLRLGQPFRDGIPSPVDNENCKRVLDNIYWLQIKSGFEIQRNIYKFFQYFMYWDEIL